VSAAQSFALCLDCWEFHYAIPDKNGVFSRDSPSSNHADHAVHVFGVPDAYPPPIRSVLAHLLAGLPISNGRLELFSLACAITAIQPTNGRAVASVSSVEAQPTAPVAPGSLFDGIAG
jgi:hypothetical protein